jgi:phage-related tail fiber protein
MSITLDGTTGIDAPAINAGNIVGQVCFFAMTTAPAGFLKANGAAVSRSVYADLFAAIGTTYGAGDGSTTFVLPDLRGEFPRGWDDGRGVDSGRGFGTAQLDQMQRITGGASTRLNRGVFTNDATTGAITTADAGDATYAVSNDFAPAATTFTFNSANSPDARVSATTSGETRSRNVALLACIKF